MIPDPPVLLSSSATPGFPVLKHRPSDFIVREVLVPRACPAKDASHAYFSLAKSGFTTMEATRIIAQAFGLPSSGVTYAGLKDEDGVTEQLVALPVEAFGEAWWEHHAGPDKYLRMARQGYGGEPLTIGGLEGNAFRILVRDLEQSTARQLCELRKVNHSFLNYYDIQRFGVPNGVRRTHLLGQCILDGRWEEALRELVRLGAPESESAERWQGPARDYFHSLDPRTTAFYLSAHESAQWNARLRQLARQAADGQPREVEVEGVAFIYLNTDRAARALFCSTPELDYLRYSFDGNRIGTRESKRTTVIQTQVAFDGWASDEFHVDRYCVEVRFFLPSGCYATAALRQLFGRTNLPG